MKTKIHLLVLSLSAATLSAQSGMVQGDHEIIIQGSARIQESLEQIETASGERWGELEKINAEFDEQFARYKDPSLSEEERTLANAKALDARARVNQNVRKLTTTNLERFEVIDDELEAMISAARNIDQSNEALQEQMIEANAQTRASLSNQEKLIQVIEDVRDGTITESTERELIASHNLHAGAAKAANALKTALSGRNQAQELQNLREIVAQRRNQLLQMDRVAQGNLKIIRLAVIQGMTWEAFSNLDQALASITSLSDPLALDTVLRPGIDAQLIRGGSSYRGGHTSASDKPSGGLGGLDYSAFGDLAP